MFWTIRTVLGSYLYIVFMILPTVIVSLFSRTGNLPHTMASQWARFTLNCAHTKVVVKGQENIPDGPAIYMSNHSSFFDVFTILGYLNVQFRWTVKKELFRIPLLGLAMRRIGYISIDRGNHEKALQGLMIAVEKIRSGASVVIFPEGTRTVDGKLQYPFKKGGFHLAVESGKPIVPMAVIGSREVLCKYGMKVNPGTITLIIDKPIYPDGHDVMSLMQHVYGSIKSSCTCNDGLELPDEEWINPPISMARR